MVAKKLGRNAKKMPKDVTQESDPVLYQHYKEAEALLIKKEAERPFMKKRVEGDASETGLVKFVAPLLEGGENGCYDLGGLSGFRAKYPTVKANSGDPAMIPFNSENKFNLIIRDMNTSVRSPSNADDNQWVYLKGAPEKVLNRCTTMLIEGDKEVPINDQVKAEVKMANDKFGGMGERVLAFARFKLDPSRFTKDPAYPYNIKDWKQPDFKDRDGYFPMTGLQLVALVSLNDPPRPQVDISVQKCREAGIQVIMVTGDQKPTAAAIAHKVNIISDPELEYNRLIELGHTKEQAMEKCRAIVIHGDELDEVRRQEEALDDNEIEKGRRVMDWIRKPEVVFARTTPSQKLLIVDACQRLGHIVAVTGDGVNDSPAIKKANIGVAMGTGSDVAQNAADMLLLDDNFSSIVNGVEEGRLIFDNLKKSIAYTLTSNIPEIFPFIFFIIFQVPLPLTTVLILCIDLGTDMVPAIAFAYEHPELHIMERSPRNAKLDYLVGKKMISFSYLQIGMIQEMGCLFSYFYVMNDYGFRPHTLFYLDPVLGYFPNPSDVYNPNLPHNGNTNFGDDNYKAKIDWLRSLDGSVDLRLFYTSRPATSWSKCRWDPYDEQYPSWYRISTVTDRPICYTTEALKHSHTSYLVVIVCLQWADAVISKTRSLSISQQGLSNQYANFGFFFESALVVCISYLPFLNIGLQTRPLALPHLGVPAWPWTVFLFLYDEMRRIFVRSGMTKEEGKGGQIKFTGWVARNTYY